MTELLVVVLAVCAVIMVMKGRYSSNLPLLFYLVALIFTNMAGRELNPYLMYTGLISALVLRFEFMGRGFTKFIAFLTGGALCLVGWLMMSEVFFG